MPLRCPLHTHDQHTHRLLSELEAGTHVSQRSLARRLGIALGLTNLLLRRLARKGWIRMVQVRPNRVSYLLTPTGVAEKTRMSRMYLKRSISFYAEARDRISDRFTMLSAEWATDGDRGSPEKRIVFFGAGELAEIAYVCLQGSDLRLIAVVDDERRKCFFDVPVCPISDLRGREVRGTRFDRLIVMAFDGREATETLLRQAEVPFDRVHWV